MDLRNRLVRNVIVVIAGIVLDDERVGGWVGAANGCVEAGKGDLALAGYVVGIIDCQARPRPRLGLGNTISHAISTTCHAISMAWATPQHAISKSHLVKVTVPAANRQSYE